MDFYRSDTDDTLVAVKGYYDERTEDERIERFKTYLLLSAWVGKGLPSQYKLWPIVGDDDLQKDVSGGARERNLKRLRDMKVKSRQKEILNEQTRNRSRG